MLAKPDPGGYALNLSGPLRHLRTALDTAPQGVVLQEIAKAYEHTPAGDYHRVKLHNKLDRNSEANVWFMQKAVSILARWLDVEERDGETVVRMKEGKTPDDMRWDGRKIHPDFDPHVVFHDLFDPRAGFADNVRAAPPKDDEELTTSLQTFGWIEEFPAIQDERGVTLVGNRRLAVAAKLGITPVIKVITFGRGDQADAKRLGLALASNLGGKPLTIADRRRIASTLYQDHEWSMQKIGEMLKVSQATISRDLDELCTVHNSGGKKKPGRPKSKTSKPLSPKAERAEKLAREGKGRTEIVREIGGGSEHIAQLAVKKEEGRREGLAEATKGRPVTCPNCGTHFVWEG